MLPKLFSRKQVERFRARIQTDQGILAHLLRGLDELQGQRIVQKTGCATWGGFYVCPEHSVALEFDISQPEAHRCPVDGKLFSGEPYDGAWWRILNEKNAHACYCSALLYLLTEEDKHLSFARDMLLAYTINYPRYEVHGGIPYNKPGRVNAQTLCDAAWTRKMAFAFDIIREGLEVADEALIIQQLLRPSAAFLMENRTRQIHNHEAVISSAIGILGILLGEESIVRFAVEEKYGLRYQLEHGLLSDGFWFEGTPAYHYYCLEQYVSFECFARGTAYSFFQSPAFVDVLKFPLRLRHADQSLPLLNDTKASYTGFMGAERIFELPYAITKDKDFAAILNYAYADKPRCNIHAFFFGEEVLPPVAMPPVRNYHAGGVGSSGLTMLHGPQQRTLLVKHSPFGGEHDHYDRLALHFTGMSKAAAADIGTSEYGAPLHYAYYKNTLTHNTVCLDGQNHPPANCETLRYEEAEGRVLLDTRVKWDGSYTPLDSFTLPQWDGRVYNGATFRRVVAWYGTFFVDVFSVSCPQPRVIDWMLHVRGARVENPGEVRREGPWFEHGPGAYIHDIRTAAGKQENAWDLGDGCEMRVYTPLIDGAEGFFGTGPDNPSVKDISYMMQRKQGAEALFINILCIQKSAEPVIQSVAGIKGSAHTVALDIRTTNEGRVTFEYDL